MEKKDLKPYVSADQVTPELTGTSVVIGVLLAVIFGAANAYLGLRVGLTVSASIPSAVISMAVIRVILKRNSILESNMVQTIGSSGESLAAGAIFTLPVLFLWFEEGIMEAPGWIEITWIALCGGLLGVLFMVPLRKMLIVKEHGVLPYPEGSACAEVLLAGENGGTSSKAVFLGMAVAGVSKFLVDGLRLVRSVITIPIRALRTELSAEAYPALVGVGYICGARISSYLFAGGLLGWFVLIPAIVTFGTDTILYPGTVEIRQLYETGGAGAIWSCYLRYIGAGAVAAGGMISLLRTIPLIATTFRSSLQSMKQGAPSGSLRTEQDLNMKFVYGCVLALILALWLMPQIPVGLVGAVVIVVFGFFFSTVSARMVGLVGGSNNPVSGMAIATLLVTTTLLKFSGTVGASGMKAAIAIGSIICIVAAMAGDTSQDLKTGFLLGATPRKQQIGEIIGTVASAFTIGGVLILLDRAWGFGTEQISAPQATLMKLIIEGVMGGNLPWTLIFIGAFLTIGIEILGIPALPVAIGLYLPLELSSTIMLGGLVRLAVDKRRKRIAGNKQTQEAGVGILFCSGLIAGEGMIGILLAVFAVMGIDGWFDLSRYFDMGIVGSAGLLVLLIVFVYRMARLNMK